MLFKLRTLLAAAAITAGATGAFAAASNMPTNYQPDPALKTASMGELRSRVSQACSATQAKLQNVSEASVSGKCGCYAGRTMRALSEWGANSTSTSSTAAAPSPASRTSKALRRPMITPTPER